MGSDALVEIWGPLGLIIAGLAWAYRAERAERIEAQKSERDTLKEVIPAVEALRSAMAYVERGQK